MLSINILCTHISRHFQEITTWFDHVTPPISWYEPVFLFKTWKNPCLNQERVSDAEYHEVEDDEVGPCEPSEGSLRGRISQIAAHVRRASVRWTHKKSLVFLGITGRWLFFPVLNLTYRRLGFPALIPSSCSKILFKFWWFCPLRFCVLIAGFPSHSFLNALIRSPWHVNRTLPSHSKFQWLMKHREWVELQIIARDSHRCFQDKVAKSSSRRIHQKQFSHPHLKKKLCKRFLLQSYISLSPTSCFKNLLKHMGVSKNSGKTPKMDGENHGSKPY